MRRRGQLVGWAKEAQERLLCSTAFSDAPLVLPVAQTGSRSSELDSNEPLCLGGGEEQAEVRLENVYEDGMVVRGLSSISRHQIEAQNHTKQEVAVTP